MCNSWRQTTVDYTNRTDPVKEEFTKYMNDNVLGVVGATHYQFIYGTPNPDRDDVGTLFEKIYKQDTNANGSQLDTYCYWRVNPGTISRRIDADLFQSTSIF